MLSKTERLELLHKKMVDEVQDFAIILLDRRNYTSNDVTR